MSVRSSIFWKNHASEDLPGYDPATYTLSQNLVQDPDLVGVGGNVTGDPRFVDAAGGPRTTSTSRNRALDRR